MLIKELLQINEAKPGRAWEGKLKRIDALLSWMYEKDILNKGEKNKKDTLFHSYYRYYNDGDKPRGMKYDSKERIESEMEDRVDEFIKTVLRKYSSKIDKKNFRFDKTLGELNTVIEISKDFDVHGLVKYWKKDIKDKDVLSLIDKLESKYDKLDSSTKKAVDKHKWENSYDNPSNYTMTARRDVMKKAKIWDDSFESDWKDIKVDMIEITTLLKNIKNSIEKLQNIHNV